MMPEREPAAADADLLRRAAAGDARAVRTLLDGAGPVVYGFVFARLAGDEAASEDVMQDTFAEAMRSATTFRGEAALTTWLCAIARRRLLRHWEAERRQAAAEAGLRLVVDEPGSIADPDPDDLAERDEVIRALAQLPATQRQVLILKYLDDRSVADIAAELGRTAVQVQSLLQRGRDGLRASLGPARDV